MSADDNRRMMSRLFALLVWALVSGSVVFWGLRLLTRTDATAVRTVAASDLTTAQADLSRLFGAAPVAAAVETIDAPAPDVSARFRLTGVVAPKHPSEQGLAVISVDGNPAKVYRVGAVIDGDLMLREVSLRTATLAATASGGDAATAFVLELPVVTAAATGVLPPALSVTVPDVAPLSGDPTPVRLPRSMNTR